MKGSKYTNPLKRYKKILINNVLYSLVPPRDIKIAKQALNRRNNRLEYYKRKVSKVRKAKLQLYENKIEVYRNKIILLKAKEFFYKNTIKKKIKKVDLLIERIEKQL